jgi:hypothetical protein
MSITAPALTRAAAAAAVVAGTIFVAVQINHPPMVGESVATTDWVVRSFAKATMSVLALAGITGMYLRQIREMKWYGLAGYLALALGYLAMFSVEIIAATVLPRLVDSNPEFVNDVIVSAAGGAAESDIGGMQLVLGLSGIGYMVGGLVFGIALSRAGVLARTPAILLAVGTISTLALAVLPEAFNRPLAVPVGLALIGLGVSLWRSVRPGVSTQEPAGVGEAVVR